MTEFVLNNITINGKISNCNLKRHNLKHSSLKHSNNLMPLSGLTHTIKQKRSTWLLF
ncbi:CS domain-containing protein [Colwellia sp. MB3u-4]|uniref:CS domain-containing protein n=1 Tax=Colwellia sp. MB3u-4 TaxID=2759822 RepID=UPI003855B208